MDDGWGRTKFTSLWFLLPYWRPFRKRLRKCQFQSHWTQSKPWSCILCFTFFFHRRNIVVLETCSYQCQTAWDEEVKQQIYFMTQHGKASVKGFFLSLSNFAFCSLELNCIRASCHLLWSDFTHLAPDNLRFCFAVIWGCCSS